MSELLTFLSVRPAKGRPEAVGTDMSTTQLRRLDSAPEVVAREADDGRMMCSPLCEERLMLVAWLKEGLRIALPLCKISRSDLFTGSLPVASSSTISGAGD